MSKFMCYVLKSSFHISWQRIRRRGKVCDLRSIFETPSLVSSYELSKKKDKTDQQDFMKPYKDPQRIWNGVESQI